MQTNDGVNRRLASQAHSDVFAIVLHASQCHNNCVFCGSKDFGQIENNVEFELEKLEKCLQGGSVFREIEISGNDPAEYADLPKVILRIRALAPKALIVIATHGRPFCDARIVQELIESGVQRFTIPVYGHRSAVHDAVTRASGSFLQTIRGMTNIVKCGGKLQITSLMTAQNQCHLQDLFDFIADVVPVASIGLPYLSMKSFVKEAPDFSLLSQQLSDALKAAMVSKRCVFHLRNVPRCLLQFEYPHFEDTRRMPVGAYEHWRSSEMFASGFVILRGSEVVPTYREFQHVPACERCKFKLECPGLLKTYLDNQLMMARPVEA